MSTFSRVRSADYKKKQNMLQNNAPASLRAIRTRLVQGDGTLPKSSKFRDWSCKESCVKAHEHKYRVLA